MTETTNTETTPTTKPGWRTTEFYLSLLATLLTALFASGLLTTNTALAIAGMAATVLTALGYKVSRTLLKNGAGILVLGLVGALALSSSAACKPYLPPVTHPVVDCVNADRPRVESLIASFWPKEGAPNWSSIEAQAIDAGLAIGGCALSEFVQKYLAPAPGNKAPPPESGWKARETLERYREQHANGATFKTALGAL